MQIVYHNPSPSQHGNASVGIAVASICQPPIEQKSVSSHAASIPRRLRAQDGSKKEKPAGSTKHSERELWKLKLILQAKRSEYRRMDQWSRIIFVGMLISRSYLDELSMEITWLEGRVAKSLFDFESSQLVGDLHPATQSSARKGASA